MSGPSVRQLAALADLTWLAGDLPLAKRLVEQIYARCDDSVGWRPAVLDHSRA